MDWFKKLFYMDSTICKPEGAGEYIGTVECPCGVRHNYFHAADRPNSSIADGFGGKCDCDMLDFFSVSSGGPKMKRLEEPIQEPRFTWSKFKKWIRLPKISIKVS